MGHHPVDGLLDGVIAVAAGELLPRFDVLLELGWLSRSSALTVAVDPNNGFQ